MTAPTRRGFLALFGCGVIGLATDWSGALSGLQDLPTAVRPPTLTGSGRAYELFVTETRAQVSRLSLGCAQASQPILAFALAPRSSFRWCAPYGGEIVFPEGRALDLISDDVDMAVPDWQLHWAAAGVVSMTGCEYCGTAYFEWPAGGRCRQCGGRLPAPMTMPAGSHFCTITRDGERRTLPLTVPAISVVDHACAYCGVQIDPDTTRCQACGAEDETC